VADVADGVARDDLELFSLDRPAMRTGHAVASTPITR
jgi:hypothetical protein